MQRANLILAVVLVLQIALGAVVFWPRSTADSAAALLADVTVDGIVGLSITDAQGNSVKARREAGSWVLPEADDYPVEGDKVTALLEKVVALQGSRLVTRTEASHKQLQVAVDDYVRRLDLELVEGSTQTLYLGSSPGSGATHVRLDGQAETYLVTDLSTWETNATPASWIDTSYLTVLIADIREMVLSNAQGELVLSQGDDGNWALEGLSADETVDQNKANSLVQRASTVSMTAPVGRQNLAAFGLDNPLAVVTLDTADKSYVLRVGSRDPEDGTYVVISSESPYYVRVGEYVATNLVEQTRADLLQVPATLTPQVGTVNTP